MHSTANSRKPAGRSGLRMVMIPPPFVAFRGTGEGLLCAALGGPLRDKAETLLLSFPLESLEDFPAFGGLPVHSQDLSLSQPSLQGRRDESDPFRFRDGL